MMKSWENNGTEEIGLVTPTPGSANTTFVDALATNRTKPSVETL